MNSGFAGIDDPLFSAPHTAMLVDDARSSVMEVIKELKALEHSSRSAVRGSVRAGGVPRGLVRRRPGRSSAA